LYQAPLLQPYGLLRRPDSNVHRSTHFTIIAATNGTGGIGIKGKLPWTNKTDMKYFKNITCQRIDETKKNAIIMGRKTFESINCKPLPNRLNVCITSTNIFSARTFYSSENDKNILFFNSLDTALKELYKMANIENIFVIGGAMLYQEAIGRRDCNELLINRIDSDAECDAFFPEIDSTLYLMSESSRLDETVVNERYFHRRLHSRTV
jgi:dihydrofolate reductase/thymidylate synthase